MEIISPSSFVNKKYKQLQVRNEEVSSFVGNLTKLLENVNDEQDEDEQKHLFADFLKNTFYKDYYIAPENKKNEAADSLPFVYLPLRDYKRYLKKGNTNSQKIKELYKTLSDTVLLKQPFRTDSNTLNKRFYNELLHIIGIEEKIQGKKVVIVRKGAGKRNEGSLIETTMSQLDSMNCVFNVSKTEYGEEYEDRLFNVALELCILWVNRIIFLKLLEAQLVKYHNGSNAYRFLTEDKIKCYNDLNTLFFRVVACDYNRRDKSVAMEFPHIPYLNSSLFEVTDLEMQTLRIGNLTTRVSLPLYDNSVLRDNKNPGRTEDLTSLEYILAFLDSYNFANDDNVYGKDSSRLINSSVLGLIFEKINGHKDGSVFTPGYITMFMCREAITSVLVKKFNEYYNWNLVSYDELKNKDLNIAEANLIVNSLRICDPAVGSGHFLVSALNEILRIKFELGILTDENGQRIKAQDYSITVDNDELIVTTAEGDDVIYKPMSSGSQTRISESQRLQETLFKEKRNIIENCLFGVDINPNSVNICRLRLWIELLKNTYYTAESDFRHLETLPNIDINIKHGNSLIHHFPLDSSLTSVLRQAGISIEKYKDMVKEYKSASDKKVKHEIEKLIRNFKSKLTGGILSQDKDLKLLKRLQAQLLVDENPLDLEFSDDHEPSKIIRKRIAETKRKISRLEKEIREKQIDSTGECPFEWRFEFPEVLDDNGNYEGFDLVIGNPPYIQLQSMHKGADVLAKMGYDTFSKSGDIYCLFYEYGNSLLKDGGLLSFITSNKWMKTDYGTQLRQWLVDNTNPVSLIDFSDTQIFDGVSVSTNILSYKREGYKGETRACIITDKEDARNIRNYVKSHSINNHLNASGAWSVLSPLEIKIKNKIESSGTPLKEWNIKIYRGVLTGCNEAFVIDSATRDAILGRCADEEEKKRTVELIRPLLRGCDIRRYSTVWDDKWLINAHNGVKGSIERIDIDNYPAVKEYLDNFKSILTKRSDKGDTPYNLRNCAYLDEFDKPKLVWLTITDRPKFAYDTTGAISLNSTYIMTGNDLLKIMACLNSKLIGWYFSLICSSTGEGTNKWEKFAVDRIPVGRLAVDSATLQEWIIAKDYDKIENEVAKAYGLDEEEMDYFND